MTPEELLSQVARFWARVNRAADDECWLWTGEVNSTGYGRFEFWHEGKRLRVLAYRLSFTLTGRALGPEQVILHCCDTPACVNPGHMSAGTQLANVRDAKGKQRLDLSGLTAERLVFCRECSRPFVGAPNRRYCDDHRPRQKRRDAA